MTAADRLLAALAACIVGCQGRTNLDRARAVVAEIEAQGWRLIPPDTNSEGDRK